MPLPTHAEQTRGGLGILTGPYGVAIRGGVGSFRARRLSRLIFFPRSPMNRTVVDGGGGRGINCVGVGVDGASQGR